MNNFFVVWYVSLLLEIWLFNYNIGGFVYTDDLEQTPAAENAPKRQDSTRLADI